MWLERLREQFSPSSRDKGEMEGMLGSKPNSELNLSGTQWMGTLNVKPGQVMALSSDN